MKTCVRCPATSASAPRWSVPESPYSQFLFLQLRVAWPKPPENFDWNSSHSGSSPADRLTGPEGRIRSGHSKSAVYIPSETKLNPRPMPSPSCSPAPAIPRMESSLLARQIGNTLAGSGSGDDRQAKRTLPTQAGVHSWTVAVPSAPFPPRFSTDGRCVRMGLLVRYRSARPSEARPAEAQLAARHEVTGEELTSRWGNLAASRHLLQLVASNPSMLSIVRLDSVPV